MIAVPTSLIAKVAKGGSKKLINLKGLERNIQQARRKHKCVSTKYQWKPHLKIVPALSLGKRIGLGDGQPHI